jgi:aminomethyltransferase
MMSGSAEVKRTPLSQWHSENGGKMVDFSGWWMPVEFEGLRAEHKRVREQVGLFDVSHMGEIRVKGPKALETVEWVTTNDVAKLEPGQAQYTLFTNDKGGIVDDLIVYCLQKNADYLLCVNAANIEKDYQWIVDHNKGADVTNESEAWGQIAIQGPKALELLSRVFGESVQEIPGFQFGEFSFEGGKVWLARTGYTGEEGGEVFVPSQLTEKLWTTLLEKGADLGVAPIGLGARDTLRTEMKYPLYGNDIDDGTNPYSAGLGWVVKAKVKDFLGKDLILSQKEQGLTHKLVGFKMLERGIPRAQYKLFSVDNEEVGWVTSGTMSPNLGEGIGIGYLKKDLAEVGTELLVEVRSRRLKAAVVKTPFVTPGSGL